MNVINLDDRRVKEINSAADLADDPLHELLRKAVVAWRLAGKQVTRSESQRLHFSTAYTYLDSISIVLGKAGLSSELGHCLSVDIYDIRKLGRIARDWTGPAGA